MSELTDILSRHYRGEALPTALPGLKLHRAETPTSGASPEYDLIFCVIATGRKRVFIGSEMVEYDPMTYLVASLNLPAKGQVIEAPYLGLSMRLDTESLAALLLDMPPASSGTANTRAFGVSRLEPDLLDPVLRLLRLFDRPQDISILAPMIQREILYRLLLGPYGSLMRQLAAPTGRLSQVSQVIDFIRERYNQSIRVEELAGVAKMSLPTFFRQFKAFTAMTPHQFQKQIRLQEARRILLSDAVDAASAAYEVGYESPSQFSRDYRLLFGVPPSRDSKRLRSEIVGPTPAIARPSRPPLETRRRLVSVA